MYSRPEASPPRRVDEIDDEICTSDVEAEDPDASRGGQGGLGAADIYKYI